MPGRVPATTRRATLGGLLAMAAVTGCDLDDLRPPEDEPEPSSPAPSETSSPDADSQLVEAAVGEMLQTLTVVGSARRFPRLQPSVRGLGRMHRAHLAVLAPGVDAGTPVRTSVRVPTSPERALRQVRAAEERLQRRLSASAVAARSGSLARLLASMSAAVAQHVAALPPTAGGAS